MNQDPTKRKLTAILSADVVGYSRLMESDESWTIQNLEENKKLMSSLIGELNGRVVDSPGDNLLAEFSSVINAVECAVKIQNKLNYKNSNLLEERRMHFRIGVNLGDVIEEDGRIYGSGVNIAARIEGLAESGGICISKKVYDEIKAKLDLGYEYLGKYDVKNISEPIRVYSVLTDLDSTGKIIREKKPVGLFSRKAVITAITSIIIVAVGIFIWRFYPSHDIKIEPSSTEPEQVNGIPEVKEAPKTIAVIPFVNISSDPEQENFVDGLSDEIITRLSHINDLHVTSSTSSFAFKGSDKTAKEIAEILEREYILEGSVRKVGNSLRITAQLIRAGDDSHLWSEIYDRELENIFEIQENIAKAVADQLKIKLGIEQSIKKLGGTDNFEAYEKYLVAEGQNLNLEFKRALESINMSISLDPGFANAWILKSVIHGNLSLHDSNDRTDEHIDDAIIAAHKVIKLEPNLAKGYTELGYYKGSRGDFIGAEINFRKAIEIQNDIFLHDSDAVALTYLALGYFKKARDILMEARINDPGNIVIRTFYVITLGLLGNSQEIEKEHERCKLLFEDKWEWRSGGVTYHRLGIRHPVSPGDITYDSTVINSVKEYLGSPEKGLANLHQLYNNDKDLIRSDITEISILAAYFGDYKLALDSMEKVTKYDAISLFNVWYPVMKEVRQLPRFKELLKEKGLVDYWKEFGWPDICRPVGDNDFKCD